MAHALDDVRERNYSQLFDHLCEELSQPQDDDRIRLIARQETDKRMLSWLLLGLFIAAVVVWGWKGVLSAIALCMAYWAFEARQAARVPGADRHLIPLQAEDYIRLKITAEAHAAGESSWAVERGPFNDGEKRVVASESDRWDDARKRMYETALEFQKLSPIQRKTRLNGAAKEAQAALENGAALAKAEDAKLIYWANKALSRLHQT
jgi:hypothetical protein